MVQMCLPTSCDPQIGVNLSTVLLDHNAVDNQLSRMAKVAASIRSTLQGGLGLMLTSGKHIAPHPEQKPLLNAMLEGSALVFAFALWEQGIELPPPNNKRALEKMCLQSVFLEYLDGLRHIRHSIAHGLVHGYTPFFKRANRCKAAFDANAKCFAGMGVKVTTYDGVEVLDMATSEIAIPAIGFFDIAWRCIFSCVGEYRRSL